MQPGSGKTGLLTGELCVVTLPVKSACSPVVGLSEATFAEDSLTEE